MLIDKRQLLIYLDAIASELKKVIALPCYNLASTSSSLISSGSPELPAFSPSGPSTSASIKWSSELNRDLLFCYYVVTNGGQSTIGYRKRLRHLWCARHVPTGHENEQRLAGQLRRIQRNHLLSEDARRQLRLEASEYDFDYHCSRARPLRISDRNRKVFRKLAKTYTRMKELHSVNRALSYVNSAVDMKFSASREIDVLTMKRVAQVLAETIRNRKDTPNIGKHLSSFLNVLVPKHFLNDTKIRHYLSHCRRDYFSLLDVADEEIDYHELHRNLKILKNLLLYVQNLDYILAIKTLMNRVYNSKCIEEVKSYYAYIFRNNSTDFLKDLEFAPFLLLQINSILDGIIQEHHSSGHKPCDRLEKIKLRVCKEIDSYKNLHQQYSNTILMIDCMMSKIKSNQSHDKIRHLFRSHLRVFRCDKNIHQQFLVQLKLQLLTYLYEDISAISEPHVQPRIVHHLSRLLYAIDNYKLVGQHNPKSDEALARNVTFCTPDYPANMISRLEKRTGRSFAFISQDPFLQKIRDHPDKRYDFLRQCFHRHKISINGSIFRELERDDEKHVEDRICQLQRLFLDQNMNMRSFDRIEEIAFEMLILETTWALSPKLLDNAESLSNYVPVLTGRNLRNYLAHGSITYEVLVSNITPKTFLQNALSIMKLSKNIISEIYERHSWDFADRLACLNFQNSIFQGFQFQNCQEIQGTIKRDRYLVGKDHLNHGIVDRLIQTRSCLLLGHLLDLGKVDELLRTLSYLMEDINIVPCEGKFHNLLTDVEARIHFCYNLAMLSNEEDILIRIVADFGYDQIDTIPMIFNFDQLYTSFLENYPDYDVNSESNAEILHYAVLSGNVELLNLLLDQCNDLNLRDIYKHTPLDVACKLSNIDMIKTLTNAGAKWFSNNLSQYLWLFLNNDHEAIIFLKNNDLVGDKIAQSCINAFLQYCEDDKEEIVELMLSYVDYTDLYSVAARFRRVNVIKYMIATDDGLEININRKDISGQTALHISSGKGFREIVRLLLNHFGDPNTQDFAGNTALHLAVEFGDTKTVSMLLTHRASVIIQNQLNQTPLDLALRYGSLRMSKILLKHIQHTQTVQIPETLHSVEILYQLQTANIQYKVETIPGNKYCDFLTPLHYAKDEGRIRILLQCFDVNVQSPKFCDTPLHVACLTNHTGAARILLKQGADPSLMNSDNLSPLHLAVINRSVEMVRIITSTRHRMNTDAINSALTIATRKGHLEIVRILLDHGADISIFLTAAKSTPQNLLLPAAREGYIRILQYLLQEQIFDVNGEDPAGSTPLFLAAVHANIRVIETLVEYGADIEHTNKLGHNVVSTAAMHDRLDIVKYFINNYPQTSRFISTAYAGKNTVLHIAVLKGSLEMVKYFLDLHNANAMLSNCLNEQNLEGFTALHICAQTGNERIFTLLLGSGADPSIPLFNEQAILHTAILNGNLNIVRVLLAQPSMVDVNACDSEHRSILHYAVFSRSVAVVKEVLRVRGLQINRQDRQGDSALHLAAENQFVDIYNLLQKHVDNKLTNGCGKRAIDILLKK
ncbi:uncharacterized protein LOC129778512 isoform X2 [Toxorhynchites rutilus septentrionalis]|nr:uncharacterized protein LOC129778512 isoform X2 [Toxorhynchites rutilus septentrionalis]